MDSLAPDVKVVLPRVLAHLASEDARLKILSCAAGVPARAVSQFGFECWLGEDSQRMDFLFKAGPELANREQLVRWARESGCTDTDAVQGIRKFAQKWAAEGSTLAININDVWLEFDITEGGSKLFAGLFFGPRAECRQTDWIINEALPELMNVPAEIAKQLRKSIALKPKDSRLFHVGLLMGRLGKGVRLCFCDLDFEAAESFLAALGWSGGPEVRSKMQKYASLAHSIALDIDVWDELGAKVGMEYYFWDRLKKYAPKLPTFMETLAVEGLATAQEAEALRLWPGFSRQSREQRWPPRLSVAGETLGGEFESVFDRTIHHVKISFQERRPARAKAYLSVKHLWVPSR